MKRDPRDSANMTAWLPLLALFVLWLFWMSGHPLIIPGSYTSWGPSGAQPYSPGDHQFGEWGWGR